MARYSIFTAPLFALFSADFYRDVGRHWRGKAFLYLLLLELVVWIPGMFVVASALKKFDAEEADKFSQQFPPIKIHDGVATVDAPQPVFIRVGDPPEEIIAIDTTGETTFEDTTAQVLLTKDKLYVKQEFQTRVYELKEFGNFETDAATIRKWLGMFAEWGPYAMYPLMVLFGYIGRIIQALVYSLAGLIMNGVLGARLEYGAILAISLVSLTAPILLGTILETTKLQLPMANLLGFSLAMAYIAFGITANRGHTDEDIHLPQGEL